MTGSDVVGMTGVTSDVFAVTAVTAVTGGSDVPAVTGEGGPRTAPAVTSVTDRRGSTWASGRDKVKGIAGAERSQQHGIAAPLQRFFFPSGDSERVVVRSG